MRLDLYVELIALRAIAAQSLLCLASMAPDPRQFLAVLERTIVTDIECMDFDPSQTGDDLNDIAAQERTRRFVVGAVQAWMSAIREGIVT